MTTKADEPLRCVLPGCWKILTKSQIKSWKTKSHQSRVRQGPYCSPECSADATRALRRKERAGRGSK